MRIGLRSIALAAAGCACLGAAAVVVVGGCIVVPPPDLGIPPARPPRILHDSVVPPTDEPLLKWPNTMNPLLVPVVVDDPNRQLDFRVFVDHQLPIFPRSPPQVLLDGGVTTISISIILAQQIFTIDLNSCHKIRVVVARSFLPPDGIAPDSLGGDSVQWKYGASCVEEALPEGSADGLPVPPQSEGGDP